MLVEFLPYHMLVKGSLWARPRDENEVGGWGVTRLDELPRILYSGFLPDLLHHGGLGVGGGVGGEVGRA